MHSFCSKLSRLAVFLFTLPAAWNVVGGLAVAAEEMTTAQDAAASAKGPAWAVAYIVVLLLVGLGIFATVRGSGRRERAKPEEFKPVVKQ